MCVAHALTDGRPFFVFFFLNQLFPRKNWKHHETAGHILWDQLQSDQVNSENHRRFW